jgi:hypothetical protein
VGRGTNGISARLSQGKRRSGLWPSHVLPTPARPRCVIHRRFARTIRPSRQPCLTGHFLSRSEPVAFEWRRCWERMRIGTGQGKFPGTAARRFGGWAARVRMSVGCGSPRPLVVCAASAVDNQAGSPRRYLRHRCYPVRKSGQKTAVDSRSRGKYVLLTPRTL